jgi:hypothetical protein
MKGGSDAPSPDPNIGKAAYLQASTGRDWLNFAQNAYKVSTKRQGRLDKMAREVEQQQLGVAKTQFANAKADRLRYNKVFKPVEDQFVKEAKNYATPARQREAAAEARADVTSAAAASRETARRQEQAMGVSPLSGRYAGIERAGELGQSLATAGAENNARTQMRDKGLALKADVANLGRGLPAQSAAATQLGLGAGSSAYGIGAQNQQLSLQPIGIMEGGYKGAMTGYAGQGDLLAKQYGLQIDAWKAQQESNAANASGFGNFIGGLAGLAFGSDKNTKTNKKPVAKGAALEAVNKMPIQHFDYKPGEGDGGHNHVGPMAQDFQKATGTGDTTKIRAQDAIGLTMKAVQDVDAKVDKIAKAVGIDMKVNKSTARRPSQSPAKARATPPKPVARPGTEKMLGLG